MTSNEIDIQRLRDVSLHTLLGVQSRGKRTMIRCPFHSDRTASMAVYPNNGYHCFGCGAHGVNAIDFVMKLYENEEPDEKKRFKLAVEELTKYI